MRSDLIANINSRIGERRVMKCGDEAEIIEYEGTKNITVKFIKSNEIVKTAYREFKNGLVKSRFTPTVYGIGVVGLEETGRNYKTIKSYTVWCDMLRRCYNKKFQEKRPTYIGCKVAKEWLFYPNFKQWYEENYYEIEGQRMNLDKDILTKGNKIYSSENCVFVPHDINMLFVKRQNDRGALPIGVHFHNKSNKYISACKVFDICNKKNKNEHLGYHNTPEEAFNAYKIAKEKNIKLVADYYKDKIPEKLYNAMYRYQVEISD